MGVRCLVDFGLLHWRIGRAALIIKRFEDHLRKARLVLVMFMSGDRWARWLATVGWLESDGDNWAGWLVVDGGSIPD